MTNTYFPTPDIKVILEKLVRQYAICFPYYLGRNGLKQHKNGRENTMNKTYTQLLIAAAILIALSAVLAAALLAGTSEPPQPPENATKVTAAPGTLILLRPGADGVDHSATLNVSRHTISDPDLEDYLWNKVTEYNRSINNYGVNETGYLTILLETTYAPEEPEKTLAAIDKITAAKKSRLFRSGSS